MSTFWAFGDSWGYGFAGKDKFFENNYSKLLCDKLGCDKFVNSSRNGMSMGCIAENFFKLSLEMQENDYVFITLPPDIRCYKSKDGWLQTLDRNCEELKLLLSINEYEEYFFEFHHSLFITAISGICDKLKLKCMMQHNYGVLKLTEWCNTSYILDKHNSLYDMLGFPSIDLITDMLNTTDEQGRLITGPDVDHHLAHRDDWEEIFALAKEKLLIVNGQIDFHPNEHGHKELADKLYELCS